ncbi:DUF3533 domain-containing protein [Dactylosporangium roseum]|uniref:DUF3533 domain-containing protein n=1 Tax=Dactylosporangium roseum TaxID=47989 RepID=A0ABY5Z526_9ACTN|nr:ABC transporter permease [Dactylosporangium roseum]UWZ36148.1 DUF3533 domain-containing protein [Dactylosporangium roseum]
MRDGVTPRAGALLLAVLALQLGFIASYFGAFHEPTPHRIPVAVTAPAPALTELVDRLNSLPGAPLDARAVPSEESARRMIDRREVYGAFVVSAQDATDRLIIASGAGASVGQALVQIFTPLEDQQERAFTTEDAKPAQLGDARGLSGFHLALGWVVGGYLVAIAVSASKGSRPANPRRALVRLGSLLAYALLAGIGGALVSGAAFGAIDGHLGRLWWFGALLVFASGCCTMALQAAFGYVGTGLAVLLFVVLGCPSAGGAYPAPLLPPFWRAVGPWLPPGLGTEAIRGIVYFDSVGVGRSALILAGYALTGAVGTLVVARITRPRPVVIPPNRSLVPVSR